MGSAAKLWAVVLANGYRAEDIDAWLLALIDPRHCRHCGVELSRPLHPGRPRVWCEAHRTAAGRRPLDRVCRACGAPIDGRRQQATTCGGRCRQRLLRARRGTQLAELRWGGQLHREARPSRDGPHQVAGALATAGRPPAPQALTRVGSRLFFTANDGSHGRELWVSDGTAAGTKLVKDLTAGPRGQVESSIGALGDVALFSPGHRDLYRTDGTAKGTWIVRSFLAVDLDDTAMKGGALVFPADDAVWKTDGTSAGTRRISPRGVQAHDLTGFRGRVWFTEFGYPEVPRLWRSDGTKAGTKVLPGVYAPSDLTVLGDRLYLDASVSMAKAPRLFRSDGTLAGTGPVRPRVRPLPGMVKGAGQLWMARMSRPLPLPDELWVSDASATGTTLVMGGAGDWVVGDEVVAGLVLDFVGVDGSIWFSAGPATEIEDEFVLTDTELWRSDGTTAGTTEAADIDPDGSSMPRGFVRLGDAILFSATDGLHGRELWRFDP